ncbi:hypothetical protein BGX28_004745 [Mortierella sp. GBA30]|nr:hypothetical protein BGX28_004745 [Mortierella sp. GBA30]
MFNANNQPSASLRRETTDEISKMYTTLYDNDDVQQQLEYAQLQQQQHLNIQNQDLVNALVNPVTWNEFGLQQQQQHIQSPVSPALSCFSGSSSPFSTDSGSAHSSPAALRNMIGTDDADDLVDMFNITIEDLLSSVSDFSNQATLFSPQYQDQYQQPIMAALDFDGVMVKQEQNEYFRTQQQYQQQLQQHQEQQRQHYQTLHSQCHGSSTSGGPQRSGSLSPVMPSSPYHHSHHRAHPCLRTRVKSEISNDPQVLSQQAPDHSSSHESTTTLMSSPSPSSPCLSAPLTPCISPLSPSLNAVSPNMTAAQKLTAAATVVTSTDINNNTIPGTEGMTVIRSEDGSIMVYNPTTESMTFRCELCPGETFGRIHDLKRHQASKHHERTWPCEFCQRPFVRRDALLRHYTVKAARNDKIHPASHETEKLMAARARAKLIC